MEAKPVKLLYDKTGLIVELPADAAILQGKDIPPISNPVDAVINALDNPIGTEPLKQLVRRRKPSSVAITVSDITRPVPNKVFLPPMLDILNSAGVADSQIVIVIGTGMHRPSTAEEREIILGNEILSRVEVIDHEANKPETLIGISDDPPVRVNRRFAQAEFHIVTGYIEPHFMAGFSGGRKGVCPALVDLATIERFHGYQTLADKRADAGVLEGNPCHEIALQIARKVRVDFLFNVAITRERQIAGIYCGDLEQAHLAGCRDVARWTSAEVNKTFDLVMTSAGGYPLDATFYQSVKGMCGALPILRNDSTLIIVAGCSEGLGEKAYADLLLSSSLNTRWREFLDRIATPGTFLPFQWDLQMRTRVLERIGAEKIWFVSDALPAEIQKQIGVNPILGSGSPRQRTQRAIDEFIAANPNARIAVIPEGPYTLLKRR